MKVQFVVVHNANCILSTGSINNAANKNLLINQVCWQRAEEATGRMGACTACALAAVCLTGQTVDK